MIKISKPGLFVLLGLMLHWSHSANAAVDCSQESIAFYLDKGFSQEQITRLCTEATPTASPETEQVAPKVEETAVIPPLATEEAKSVKPGNPKDIQIYLQLAIEAESLRVSPEQISYKRQECFEQGDVDLFIYNDRACALIYTEIKIPGLKVVKMEKGSFLFVDKELVVQSEIHRKVMNKEDLSNASLKVLDKLLDSNPAKIDIPLRDGFEPVDVAERLKSL